MDIYKMNSDGSSVARLTNMGVGDAFPKWSPDGTKIAFGSSSIGHIEVYVMNADGSGVTRLTDGQANSLVTIPYRPVVALEILDRALRAIPTGIRVITVYLPWVNL